MKIPAKSVILFLFSFLLFAFTIKNPPKKKPVYSRQKNPSQKAKLVSLKANPYYIVIDKSDYELRVYDTEGWYATYPVVFGSNDLNDKFMAGDKRTPEGNFKVLLKKIHPKFGPELLLDFPNQESIKKFNERMNRGLVPRSAKIGNGIAIHATRPEEEWTVDYFQNWTDGCISLKYKEAKDLYSYIPAGTPVTIQK
jgi:murein L,D-transpeptidase YafK